MYVQVGDARGVSELGGVTLPWLRVLVKVSNAELTRETKHFSHVDPSCMEGPRLRLPRAHTRYAGGEGKS